MIEYTLKILIGCEESQAVANAFRKLGHEAYSNDLLECSGGHPEYHLHMDVFEAIKLKQWDLIILHPPCTALAVSGNGTYGTGMRKEKERKESALWTEKLWTEACSVADYVVLENPVGVLNKLTNMPKPQYIQPWMFGHGETKKTGLWTKGLPLLKPTNIVAGREQKVWKMGPSPERALLRSKTYQGIADALADQYSKFIIEAKSYQK